MGYLGKSFELLKKIIWLSGASSHPGVHPKLILAKILTEVESRKKLGIEENAFVPNVYAVYLSPADYEELSPFLLAIKDQLKNKLMEKVRKRGYKMLSSSVSVEIREDSALERNQVAVESSFLKEKQTAVPIRQSVEKKPEPKMKEPVVNLPFSADLTRMVEEKMTKMVDNTRVKLEILEGNSKGDVITLKKEGDYTFGRGREAKILLADSEETVSRVHFKISLKENRVGIRDLNSTNGTKVNGIEIEETELKKGDEISAGKVILKVA